MIYSHYSDQASLVLFHGEALTFVKEIPDNSIQLVITSPPYNIGKEYEEKLSLEDYIQSQVPILHELYRVLSPKGSIVWQVGNYVEKGEVFPLDILYYPIFKKLGMFLRNRIVWRFGHGLHASHRFSGRYETLLWFSKSGKGYTFNLDSVRVPSKYPGKLHYKGLRKGKPSGNPLGKNPSDVWEFLATEWDNGVWDIPNVKSNHPEKTPHPCQFPIELVERCVLALTDEGDRVFDPYAGTGSSLIASSKRGRKGIGSEKSQQYIDIAYERIGKFLEGHLTIRELGTPVYQPTGKEKTTQIPKEWETSCIK